MLHFLRFLSIVSLFFLLLGCASNRTKWSDPAMRVAISPDGLDASSYTRIQHALIQSGKFWVVDRRDAFWAALKEQDMTRITMKHRFDDREKFSRISKMYGVGGIIVGHQQCVLQSHFFSKDSLHCFQYVTYANSSTGEIIAAGSGEEDAPEALYGSPGGGESPSWNNAVNQMVSTFPTNFEKAQWSDEMKQFKNTIEEETHSQNEE